MPAPAQAIAARAIVAAAIVFQASAMTLDPARVKPAIRAPATNPTASPAATRTAARSVASATADGSALASPASERRRGQSGRCKSSPHQTAAQPLPRLAEPPSQGRLATSQLKGCLCVRLPLQVAQHHRHSQLARQPRQLFMQRRRDRGIARGS